MVLRRGLTKHLAITKTAFFNSTLSLCGSMPLACLWSNDEILNAMCFHLTLKFQIVYIAAKVFKSKSSDQVVGSGGGVKAKDIRGPYSSREKNEVLVDRWATVEVEAEKLQNCVELVEAEMANFKDTVFQRLDICIPFSSNAKHGSPVPQSSHSTLSFSFADELQSANLTTRFLRFPQPVGKEHAKAEERDRE
ncbi:hypothetical protein Cgig2_001555 [Carnegiea gigantea]|uniref:Uncharacterized protein n=1 Tax=Carnegiea gigantea TaxID=171969 RepID=A0A9Q1QA22_9CARY|nr:hypothetical protein Cgig2_001555 [Carnegiea gigantea]